MIVVGMCAALIVACIVVPIIAMARNGWRSTDERQPVQPAPAAPLIRRVNAPAMIDRW